MAERTKILVCTSFAGDEGVISRLCAYNLACAKHKCELVIVATSAGFYVDNNTIRGDIKTLKEVELKHFDAVVVFSEIIKDKDVLDYISYKCTEFNIPVFMEERHVEGGIDFVNDYTTAFEELCRHVVEHHGCRKVNFMGGMPDNSFSKDREDIYKKVLIENGIPIEPSRLYYGQFWERPTMAEMDRMLAEPELPDAIICANDTMACAVCDKLRAAGYEVPDDVIVTGLDGISTALWNKPSITTCRIDIDTVTELKVEKILEHIHGKSKQKRYVLPYTFEVRESCGCMHGMRDWDYLDLHAQLENSRLRSNFQMIMYELQIKFTEHPDIGYILNNMTTFLETESCVILRRDIEEFWNDGAYDESDPDTKPFRVWFMQGDDRFARGKNVEYNEMYEMFQQDKDNPVTVIILPLYFIDKSFGYVIFKTEREKIFFMNNMLFPHAFSIALGIFRTQRQMIEANELLGKANERLAQLYVKDNLTGLYNRHGFYNNAERIMKYAQENHNDVYIISIDMDGLKVINDTYGHAEGDNSLRVFGKSLDKSKNDREICARFGGDEFVVMGYAVSGKRRCREFVQRLERNLNQYNAQSAKPYKVMGSIGSSVIKAEAGMSIDELILSADKIMYANKVERKKNQEHKADVRTGADDLLHDIKQYLPADDLPPDLK